MTRSILLGNFLVLFLIPVPAFAGGDVSSEQLASLQISPANITLPDVFTSQQLVVTGILKDGSQRDVTHLVQFRPANAELVRITENGRLLPRKPGQTQLTVSLGETQTKVPITIRESRKVDSVDFVRDIAPLLSKTGCNALSCHGWQNKGTGLSLSPHGTDPQHDYDAIVKSSRGRLVFPASPANSLLLLKAANMSPHEGGKNMAVSSEEYALFYRWIRAGMPYGTSPQTRLTKIHVFPESRILTQKSRQQLQVTAYFSDGRSKDVTHLSRFRSSNSGVVGVRANGLVSTFTYTGSAQILVRYRDQLAGVRMDVPYTGKLPVYEWEPSTLVDTHLNKRWKSLNLIPSQICSDAEFVRRITLHLTGKYPTAEQVKTFLANKEPDRRRKLADRLLDSPECSQYFANRMFKQFNIKNKKSNNNPELETVLFYNWLRDSIAQEKPMNQLARELFGAVGDAVEHPATVWYRDRNKPNELTRDAFQVFLGIDVDCARCHAHPDLNWTPKDYWSMVGFFSQVGRKNETVEPNDPFHRTGRVLHIYHNPRASFVNPLTNELVELSLPNLGPVTLNNNKDPRHSLGMWILRDQKKQFARTLVDRYWRHFFHRGLLPEDGAERFLDSGPNSELLQALTEDFANHGYSLKHLFRTLCHSQAYQLASQPHVRNESDGKFFSHFHPRTLTEEELFDTLCQLNGDTVTTLDLPKDEQSSGWAIIHRSLPNHRIKPTRPTSDDDHCPAQEVSPSVSEKTLVLLQSQETQKQLSQAGSLVDRLAKDERPDAKKVEELFLWILNREPTAEQVTGAVNFIEGQDGDKKAAYEQLLWYLLGTQDFLKVK